MVFSLAFSFHLFYPFYEVYLHAYLHELLCLHELLFLLDGWLHLNQLLRRLLLNFSVFSRRGISSCKNVQYTSTLWFLILPLGLTSQIQFLKQKALSIASLPLWLACASHDAHAIFWSIFPS